MFRARRQNSGPYPEICCHKILGLGDVWGILQSLVGLLSEPENAKIPLDRTKPGAPIPARMTSCLRTDRTPSSRSLVQAAKLAQRDLGSLAYAA